VIFPGKRSTGKQSYLYDGEKQLATGKMRPPSAIQCGDIEYAWKHRHEGYQGQTAVGESTGEICRAWWP
jgi:hypothetical protein